MAELAESCPITKDSINRQTCGHRASKAKAEIRQKAAAPGQGTARRKGLHVKRTMFCGGVQSGWLYLAMPRVVVVTRRFFAWDLFPVVPRVDFDPAGASPGTPGPRRSLGWSLHPAGASRGASAYVSFRCCRHNARPSWAQPGLGIIAMCRASLVHALVLAVACWAPTFHTGGRAHETKHGKQCPQIALQTPGSQLGLTVSPICHQTE